MKKPSVALSRDRKMQSLQLRITHLERTTAALSARMLSLFGPVAKHVDVPAVGAVRPAIASVVR